MGKKSSSQSQPCPKFNQQRNQGLEDVTYQQYIIIIPTLYMNEGLSLNFSSKMYPFMHMRIEASYILALGCFLCSLRSWQASNE